MKKTTKLKKMAMTLLMSTMIISSIPPVTSAKELTDSTNDDFYYSHTLTNVKHAWANKITGKGVKIAVVDSGVNLNNPDLIITGGVSFVDDSPTYKDENGHGTHVAGIIKASNNGIGPTGVAYDAKLYAVKVSGKHSISQVANIAKGIQWSVDNNMDIINISIAIPNDSSLIRNALNNAEKKGILVVAAVGNEASTVRYPAKYENVIAVGAVDRDKLLASFSNTGSEVDIVAPGVKIPSTLGTQFGTSSGTSTAAPYVTGMLALYKQAYPNKSASELKQMLYKNTLDLGVKGKDNKYGYGLVQFPNTEFKQEEQPKLVTPTTKPTPTPNKPSTQKPKEEKPKENIVNLDGIVALNVDTKHFGWKGTKGATRYQLNLERVTNSSSPKFLGKKLIADTKYDLKRLNLQNNNEYVLTITPNINQKYDQTKEIKVKISIINNVYNIAF